MLEELQRSAFAYFIDQGNPQNGLTRDSTRGDAPASIAAVGMALTALPVGVERGFIAVGDARDLALATLRFFAGGEQSGARHATGHKGFYYHYLDMETGRRVRGSELSSIDTAILMAGILTVGQYFDDDEIGTLADTLYRRVEWDWMMAGSDAVCLGWTPERGFMRWHWRGYNEALILYVLGLGSPTHPLPAGSYEAWMAGHRWRRVYGIDHVAAGPLFIHQLSQIWLDLRGARDDFMRVHDCDYFENSRRATLVQQRYAIRNPRRFTGYGALCWGLTASDGPGRIKTTVAGRERRFYDYVARGAPHGPDDGTIAPWAAIACLPFAPDIVLPTIARFSEMKTTGGAALCLLTSFNETFPEGWVSPRRFGIAVGPVLTMIENYRSGFPWQLMRGSPHLRRGLERAKFRPV